MISIRLPDGSQREFDVPVTVAQVAASIGAGLAKAAHPRRPQLKTSASNYVGQVVIGDEYA